MEKPKKPEEQINTPPAPPKMRQIVIETDGSKLSITKMEVAGMIELRAIFVTLINHIDQETSKK